MDDVVALADRLRHAFEDRDLDAAAPLFADDVRWGDDDHPRRCRSRSDVLATFSRVMADGLDADVTELTPGPDGILCALTVHQPGSTAPGAPPTSARRHRRLYHAYLVVDGRIADILPFGDRRSAAAAVGLR